MSTLENLAALRLARTETVGPITFHRLVKKYGSAMRALEALPILTKNKPITLWSLEAAQQEIDALTALGGRMIFAGDAHYPPSLAQIEDAPPVLSVLGDSDLLSRQSIAIVGSRNASLNGRKFAQKIASDLGQEGCVVTSGLARGIDTAAHEGSLSTGTIAVVAGGVDVVYPRENLELYKHICARGLVVSECALGTQPLAQHFPKRNRIVSGLSAGTVVVEANLKSGSLITARIAGEQGRDVMAVPGFPLDPRSEGTNALIRDGATLVRSAPDIIENVRSFLSAHGAVQPSCDDFYLSEDAPEVPYDSENLRDQLFTELSSLPVYVDEIVRACNLKSAVVQSILLEMELEGLVHRLPGNKVCLASAA